MLLENVNVYLHRSSKFNWIALSWSMSLYRHQFQISEQPQLQAKGPKNLRDLPLHPCTSFQRSTCQDWMIMTWLWRVRSKSKSILSFYGCENPKIGWDHLWSFDNEDKSDARRKFKENKQSVSFKYLSHPWRDTSSNKQDQVLHRFFGQQWRTCHWVRSFGQQSQVLHGRL